MKFFQEKIALLATWMHGRTSQPSENIVHLVGVEKNVVQYVCR